MQFILSVLSVFIISTSAFDYISFQRKYCFVEENPITASMFFTYKLEFMDLEYAYMCEDFKLTEEDLDSMAHEPETFSSIYGTTIFRHCEIGYLNENLLSKFPNSNFFHFEECIISFKNSKVTAKRSVQLIYTLGFESCDINDNLKSQAFHNLPQLSNLLFWNCTFQHPVIEYSLLSSQANLSILAFDKCNIDNFERGILSQNQADFDFITCDSCQLTEIDSLLFAMKKSVNRVLSFSNNSLTKLPSSWDTLASMIHLRELNLSGNRIIEPILKRVDFKNLENLKIIDLSRNHEIKAISYKAFTNTRLQKLNMSQVQLTSLDKLGNGNLTIIDFSFNNITEINSKVFEELFHLRSLNLSNNYIHQLQPTVFKDLVKLKELRLGTNKIRYIPKNIFDNLKRLEILDLNHNLLRRIDGFDMLESLQQLILEDNHIKIIPSGPAMPRSLLILDISSNPLRFIGPNSFSNLKNLTSLDMTNVHNIQFKHNIFEHLTSLEVLRMQYNHMLSLGNLTFPLSTKSIDLSRNSIKEVNSTQFDYLINLEYLNLSRNKIKNISNAFASLLPLIRDVDISDQE